MLTPTAERLEALRAEAAALQAKVDAARAAGRRDAATCMTWAQVRAVVRLLPELRQKVRPGQQWEIRLFRLAAAAGRPMSVTTLDEALAYALGVSEVAALVLPGAGTAGSADATALL
jgi:hypothetical protein